MDFLTDFFLNNPIVVLIMTVITLLSAIITIAAHWKPFCRDLLLKKVTFPVYGYLILFIVVSLLIMLWPTAGKWPEEPRTIENESFGVQRIIVDGKLFVNCNFTKTELVYRGEAKCTLKDCTLKGVGFTFDGPAASTIETLKGFYAVPSLRPMIENTFKAIKEGDLPRAVPPSRAADD